MSATYINLDPIAQSIRSFGSGLANNALKKAQLDRQYAQDIVAFDKAQADIDYTNARNQREGETHTWAKTLVGGYDPNLLTPQQRNMIAINTMAPRNVGHDSILAADKILNPGGAGGSGDYEALNMKAIERFFPKRDENGQVVINQMTGLPEVDGDAISRAAIALNNMGIRVGTGSLQHYGMGLIKPPSAPEQPSPQPVATNLPTQTANQPKVGPIDIPSMQAVIEQMYRIGDISKEQAIEMAKMYGIKL